jgi:hypothetical protein
VICRRIHDELKKSIRDIPFEHGGGTDLGWSPFIEDRFTHERQYLSSPEAVRPDNPRIRMRNVQQSKDRREWETVRTIEFGQAKLTDE